MNPSGSSAASSSFSSFAPFSTSSCFSSSSFCFLVRESDGERTPYPPTPVYPIGRRLPLFHFVESYFHIYMGGSRKSEVSAAKLI